MPVPIPHHEYRKRRPISLIALRDFVVGTSDGLTVPFALAAGLCGAVQSNSIIIVAGLAEIIAGTIAMGLGGFLAGQTEIEHYEGEQRREELEVKKIPKEEMDEVKNLLESYGISTKARHAVARDLAKDHSKWVDFMMRFELGLEKPDPRQAFFSGFRIGLSYAVGGLVPLSAYFFTRQPMAGLFYSSLITVTCLLVFGYYKASFTGQKPVKGAFTVTAVGMLAAGAAFAIARLITG
jgi:VIT1/CCC1 family predicted Fe2+/Mn2+ transporter